MESKRIQTLFRLLFSLLGAGIGAGLMALVLQLYTLIGGSMAGMRTLIILYAFACIFFGLLFFLFSTRIVHSGSRIYNEILEKLNHMDGGQLLCCIIGLVLGLLVSSLLSRIIALFGNNIFAIAATALLYLVLGIIGWNVGRIKGRDMLSSAGQIYSSTRIHRFHKKSSSKIAKSARKSGVAAKVLDVSAIIDGRICELCKLGFLEGELVIPQFVLNDIRRIADSADPTKRSKGKRGLEMLKQLQDRQGDSLRVTKDDWLDTDDVDVKIIRLVTQTNAVLVTCDSNLSKIAAISRVHYLNINELANVMKPVVAAGDSIMLTISKEGKDPRQGVGYMADGTMVVVENGRHLLNESITVTVTSILQTSGGRMIFARLPEGETAEA